MKYRQCPACKHYTLPEAYAKRCTRCKMWFYPKNGHTCNG